MELNKDEIHIWTTSLAISPEEENVSAKLLSPDELERANRFRFPEHRRRFIAARVALRQILSIYTKIAPEKLIFSYGEHEKPALANSSIQFNISHSEDLAAYAIAHQPVGVDIEKIKDHYESGLPERFFSSTECLYLAAMPDKDKITAFYRIWARKEAIIKASGKGLAVSLSSFSVSPSAISETVQFGREIWHLQHLSLDSRFAAALASQAQAETLLYYNFPDHLVTL